MKGASSGEELGAPPRPVPPAPAPGSQVSPAAPRGRSAWDRKKPRPKFPSVFLPLLGPRRFGPAQGVGSARGGAQAAEADLFQRSGRRVFLANPAPLGFLPPERPRPSAGSTARPSRGQKARGPLGQLSRALPLDSQGRAGPRGRWTAVVTGEASVLCWGVGISGKGAGRDRGGGLQQVRPCPGVFPILLSLPKFFFLTSFKPETPFPFV